MKIVQVVRGIHPHGGISGVAFSLAAEFDKKGVSNDFIYMSKSSKRIKSKILDRLHYIYESGLFTFLGSLRILISRDVNTVFIVHGDALGGDIYVDHGLHKEVVRQKPSMFLRNPYHILLYLREDIRHRFSFYAFIVSLSRYSENLLHKNYEVSPSKVVRIPNGIDLTRFSVPRVAHSGFGLIFIGHEYERKGLKHAINALTMTSKDVFLTVVGGSSEEISSHQRLAEKLGVSERVNFVGRRTDVPELLSSHDLLVLPSRFESWQLVVLEAMAAGVPVLSTPVGCAEEVVHDGSTGFIIKESGESIAEKVNIVFGNPGLLESMRSDSIDLAKKYSWEAISEKYLALAEKIIKERSANDA